jgi:hypothetical protein
MRLNMMYQMTNSVWLKEYIDILPDNNHLFEGAFEILDYQKKNINCT